MDGDGADLNSDVPRLLDAFDQTGGSRVIFAKRTRRSEGAVFALFYRLYDRAELASVSRHLASGGKLIVLSLAFPALFSKFDTALGHVRRYTAKSLSAAFPAHLRRERVFYADSIGALASLANRLLLRQSMPDTAQIKTWDKGIIPVSRKLDPLIRRRFGRSVTAIYSGRRSGSDEI